MGALSAAMTTPAHELGAPLSGPLKVYGPVTKQNLSVAISLQWRYFITAVRSGDLRWIKAEVCRAVALRKLAAELGIVPSLCEVERAVREARETLARLEAALGWLEERAA